MAVNTYTSFEITISPEWVLAHKGDDELPVKRIIDRLQKDLAAEITTYTLASCEGYVSADEDSANTISCIRRIVESLYPDDKDFFTIGLSEKNLVPEEETKPVKKTRKKAAKPEAVPEERERRAGGEQEESRRRAEEARTPSGAAAH